MPGNVRREGGENWARHRKRDVPVDRREADCRASDVREGGRIAIAEGVGRGEVLGEGSTRQIALCKSVTEACSGPGCQGRTAYPIGRPGCASAPGAG
jgi:hypothetical protein